ncbi:DUF1932 domain-containing protein [Nocardiopsis sp. CNR-923]|uniref:DUF1932 domain-containing protein n=1 Tax=Nocardiopsis sp. CNR-923 TaxID=1904965 RepID=UPI0021CC6C78|nr:DUF1932 domain-containing protein [Nocardiopsis sp. CNR-923]
MAYGSYQKAACALAAVAQALADAHGVSEQLTSEARRLAKSPLATPDHLSGVAAKAWRWAPEMREVADTLAATGLPGDLARAAASRSSSGTGARTTSTSPCPTCSPTFAPTGPRRSVTNRSACPALPPCVLAAWCDSSFPLAYRHATQ